MLKRCGCAFLTIILALSLSGCGEIWSVIIQIREIRKGDAAPKEDIFQFVLENEEYLLQCLKQSELETLENYGIIKDVYESDNYIDFSCGGSGFASQTNHTGFIYSKYGNINAARPDIRVEDMIPDGNGYYWHEENGDNSYYIENIIGRFYYYYEHY